tara:strand:- start:438 stop:599 length:162 start_codon:yes stop_codon:yes gene_type:complete
MSDTLKLVIKRAIEDYLEKNDFHTISPNLLSEETQKELTEFIENAIVRYMGKS